MIEFAMDQDELGKKIISNIDRHFRVDPKMYVKRFELSYNYFLFPAMLTLAKMRMCENAEVTRSKMRKEIAKRNCGSCL